MFLQNQFFFFEIYFQLVDHLRCITFSWNTKLESFEMTKSLRVKCFSYGLLLLHFIYMTASSYVLLNLKLKGTEVSTISLVFHLYVITGFWYLFLFRSFYTTKARDLVCIMNAIIRLEKQHLQSKKLCCVNDVR